MNETVRRIAALLRSLVLLGAGNYGAMAVSLAINAFLTRRLGVEAFGRLALMLSLSQMALLLTVNWSQPGAVRFGAQAFESTGSVREAFWSRTWVAAPWALVAALVVLVARDRIAAYLTIPPWAVVVVLAHFLAVLLLTTIGAMFQARNEMPRYGATLFLDKAVMGLLLLVLPQAWIADPSRVLGAYAASSIGVAGWGIAVLGRGSFWPVVFDRVANRRMMAFSLPLILSSWAGLFGTNWLDLVIIKWYRPVADVGLYSLGTLLAGVVQQITIVFSTWLLPQLSVMVASRDDEQIRRLVDRAFPYWFMATSVIFGVVAATAGWVVPSLFGGAFEPSVSVLTLLMPAACALALFNAFSPLVTALGSTWVLTGICLASGATNVLMDLVLIPPYGIRGAALATVIAYATSAGLALAFVHARFKWPVFRLALFALPVVIVSAGVALLDGLTFLLVAVPASAGTLYWLARAFQLFRREDVTVVANLRRPPRIASDVPLSATRRP